MPLRTATYLLNGHGSTGPNRSSTGALLPQACSQTCTHHRQLPPQHPTTTPCQMQAETLHGCMHRIMHACMQQGLCIGRDAAQEGDRIALLILQGLPAPDRPSSKGACSASTGVLQRHASDVQKASEAQLRRAARPLCIVPKQLREPLACTPPHARGLRCKRILGRP
jgi:hypothetical protein